MMAIEKYVTHFVKMDECEWMMQNTQTVRNVKAN